MPTNADWKINFQHEIIHSYPISNHLLYLLLEAFHYFEMHYDPYEPDNNMENLHVAQMRFTQAMHDYLSTITTILPADKQTDWDQSWQPNMQAMQQTQTNHSLFVATMANIGNIYKNNEAEAFEHIPWAKLFTKQPYQLNQYYNLMQYLYNFKDFNTALAHILTH